MATALTAASLAFLAIGITASPVTASEEVVVTIRALQYSPAEIEIETGTTVIWRNAEVFDYPDPINGTHRARSADGSFDTGEINPGQQYVTTFLEPVTLAYACVMHPNIMKGSVKVTGEPISEVEDVEISIEEPNGLSDTDSYRFDPGSVTIEAGATVTWRNNGAAQHTVLADDGSFDSGILDPGETFERTFDEPVSLRYKCEPHPWMTGIVRVRGAGGEPPPPPPPPEEEKPGEVVVPDRGAREGDGPATFDILVVEPSLSDPQGWGYSPPSLTARVGDTVVWTNTGSTAHTATASDGSFDSGTLEPGATFDLKLADEGTFAFACVPHPWMKGTLVVQAASAPRGEQPPTGGGPIAEPGGGAGGEGEEPSPGDEEGAPSVEARRTILAAATAAASVLFGIALLIPALLMLRKTPRGAPPALEEPTVATPEREPVGATR